MLCRPKCETLALTNSRPPISPPLTCIKHYYSRQIAGTNLPTPKGWIPRLARAHVYVHNLLRVITHWLERELSQVDSPKISLDANEPTAPYITGRELNLRKLPGRQWESNQPSTMYLCMSHQLDLCMSYLLDLSMLHQMDLSMSY